MQPCPHVATAGRIDDIHRGGMTLDDPPHRPILGQDQNPADEARPEPKPLGRNHRSEPLLGIESPVRLLERPNRCLHLTHDHCQCRPVCAEHVDGTSFPVANEAHLRGSLPAPSLEGCQRRFHQRRVTPVDQAVCSCSAPPWRQASSPVDGQEHPTKTVQLDATRSAILDGDDVAHWHACPSAEALPVMPLRRRTNRRIWPSGSSSRRLWAPAESSSDIPAASRRLLIPGSPVARQPPLWPRRARRRSRSRWPAR